MISTKRLFHAGAAALALLATASLPASSPASEDAPWRHGLSMFGSVKYPPDFKHFDYVNPTAPKGGAIRVAAPQATFDNFNMVVSGVKGNLTSGITLIYDNLLESAADEVSTEYGMIAEAIAHPPDFAWAKFRLRPEAKFHDGQPITVEDVIYSLQVVQKHNPQLGAYYRHVAKVEKTGEREVTFTFDSKGNRELPTILGQLTVLPKHYWEGTDANGRKRDISATTLEPPLGSGAYRIKSFEAGRYVIYERVPDYWGRNLPVNVGRNNFEQIRYDYFRDGTVALEAFKADQLDWRFENSARNWATAYDFPATRDKRVVLEEFPYRNRGSMQGFAFNIRRDKFKDPRVRNALNYMFDFEELNKTLFYGQYSRIGSYFEGTELAWNWRPTESEKQLTGGGFVPPPAAASGLPEGQELEILETVRDKVPPEVFTKPYKNPVGGSPEAMRNNLREAIRLFKEAGYEIRDRRMVNAKTGEPFTFEILLDDPSFERIVLFMRPALERLGVTMTVRTVDEAQYENRRRDWDFDVIVGSWPESLSPGNEQRYFWGSAAADQPGTRNYIGIKNPAVDVLIDRIIFAKDRAELVAATRAMDRVLLWNHYVIPQFTYSKMRSARWDRFDHPKTPPIYASDGTEFPSVWWYDAARAAKIGTRQ